MQVHANLYIFMGPPGSGKGTLSHLCSQRLGWEKLSTGDLCRKHILEQSDIGREIDFAIKSGKLVSDSLITSMVERWMEDRGAKTGSVILDGYPRTVTQAQDFEKLMGDRFPGMQLVITRLVVPDAVLKERLGGRLVCSSSECQAVYAKHAQQLRPKCAMICDRCGHPLGARKDDREETIGERLRTYHEHEAGLVQFYQTTPHPLIQLDGQKDAESVFQEFKKVVDSKKI